MNDPITTLVGALLHARGRFEYYATNHNRKAVTLQGLMDEQPDSEHREQTQALINDTLGKAQANLDEVVAIDRAIQNSVQLVPAEVRVVPLELIGAALYCVGRVAPGGPTQAALRAIVFGENPGVTVLPDDVRSPDVKVLVGSAQHTAGRLDMTMGARASLSPGVDHMEQLTAFHDTYAVPMHTLGNTDPNFSHMTDDRVAMRLDLIAEEVIELFEDGFGTSIEIRLLSDSLADFGTASISEAIGRTQQRDGAEVADALGDIVYLCYGMALEMGYDLRKIIAEIHASNLTKLGADGQPIMREDGKVLKGPNYQIPNIPLVLGWIEHEAS